jgi:hypothetical protein
LLIPGGAEHPPVHGDTARIGVKAHDRIDSIDEPLIAVYLKDELIGIDEGDVLAVEAMPPQCVVVGIQLPPVPGNMRVRDETLIDERLDDIAGIIIAVIVIQVDNVGPDSHVVPQPLPDILAFVLDYHADAESVRPVTTTIATFRHDPKVACVS